MHWCKSSTKDRQWLKGKLDKPKDYVKSFTEITSIHGLRHVMERGRHPLELALWMLVIVLSIYGATSLILSSWNRYSANPTVVSLEKDYKNWKIPFPTGTFCFIDRLNETKALEYINRTWGSVNDTMVKYYLKFLGAVVNMSYNNLIRFKEFANHKSLETIDMEQIILELLVDPGNQMTLEYNNIQTDNIVQTLTELGVCFTALSAVAHHFSIDKLVQGGGNHTVCVFESFCSAQLDIKKGLLSFEYGVHSPFEVPDTNTRMYTVDTHSEHKTNYKYVTIAAAASLRHDLAPAQRRCRFPDEVDGLAGLPLYSYNLCSMRCRQSMAVKLCDCSPFFYKMVGGPGKTCNVTGLACVSNYIAQLTRASCGCLPLCEEVIYYPNSVFSSSRKGQADAQLLASDPILYPTIGTWRLLELTKYRFNRDIVFSFADLLVSFGGTAALFLGCSLLSGVELIYFFTLRLVCYLVRVYKSRNSAA